MRAGKHNLKPGTVLTKDNIEYIFQFSNSALIFAGDPLNEIFGPFRSPEAVCRFFHASSLHHRSIVRTYRIYCRAKTERD